MDFRNKYFRAGLGGIGGFFITWLLLVITNSLISEKIPYTFVLAIFGGIGVFYLITRAIHY